MGELRIERNFPVPPAKVYAFVTEMDNLLTWWGPEGTRVGDHDLDFTEAGDWFFYLVDPTGEHHKVSGVVLEVNPPHYVEFTLIVHSKDGPPSIDSVVRFEVSPNGEGGAIFVLTQTGLSSEQIVEGSTNGWISTLTRLETILNSIANKGE